MVEYPDTRVTYMPKTSTQRHVISRDYVHFRLALEAQSVRVHTLRLRTLFSAGTPTKATNPAVSGSVALGPTLNGRELSQNTTCASD